MRACAAWWCARVTRPEHVGFGSVLSATLWERRRTSSAELERSAAIPLAGMQLDSSPLVLVAEVSSLLALRPRPIVRDVWVFCVRREGAITSSAPCAMGRRRACAARDATREPLTLVKAHLFPYFASSYLCLKLLNKAGCCRQDERVKFRVVTALPYNSRRPCTQGHSKLLPPDD